MNLGHKNERLSSPPWAPIRFMVKCAPRALPQSNFLIENFSRVLFHFDVDAPTETGLRVALLQKLCEPLTAKKFSNSISKKILSANTPEFNPIVATNQRCITLTRSIALLTYATVIDRIRGRDFPKNGKSHGQGLA